MYVVTRLFVNVDIIYVAATPQSFVGVSEEYRDLHSRLFQLDWIFSGTNLYERDKLNEVSQ